MGSSPTVHGGIMNKSRKLAAQMTTAIAIATLFGTSAFAEERHRDATSDQTQQQTYQQRRSDRQGRNHDQQGQAPANTQQQQQQQQFDRRGRQSEPQTWQRDRANGNWDRGGRNNQQQFDRGRTYNQQ